MRQIILDTETTGLEPGEGHRIIELAGVEIRARRNSGNHLHRYLNPERDSDAAALQVHGLTAEFLADKPKFAQVVDEFLDFVQGAELIIHNAAFDVAFLDYELGLLNRGSIRDYCPSIIDTLKLAKELHPGKRNGLDALCERYGIDNSRRSLHGALLDAELLAEAYLAMTRGQESLVIDISAPSDAAAARARQAKPRRLLLLRASAQEQAAHLNYLQGIAKTSKGECLWLQLESAPA